MHRVLQTESKQFLGHFAGEANYPAATPFWDLDSGSSLKFRAQVFVWTD